ncbi:MAG TPA: biotin carboxylase N-terminal domain-containing protein [Mycobacteriales bacterium]|nr:biotin carboxylase N-terminal domain-containing protein [Mycobacteriales bacterium]
MFETVLVANRGEIAVRVIRTCQRLGLKAIAVHSAADAGAAHVRLADEAMLLGPAPAAESYLDIDRVLEAAKVTGAQAVHPGYGFLAENPVFAARVAAAGLTWIGPPADVIELMGDKVTARNTMTAAGVPVAPGTAEPVTDLTAALAAAADVGYPLMVKASAGGGGIGMSIVEDESGLTAAFETARTRAERFFGSPKILLERYIPSARHIEVQVLGLADGTVVALGERDCSVQRRHQKVFEETPSPGISAALRARMLAGAVQAASAVGYRNAGTVECLVPTGGDAGHPEAYFFLEMNTRLQVEHPVTELVTGVDLVEQQLLIAAGEPVSFAADRPLVPNGHAVEFRVYAEDPKRFLPGPGKISRWDEPTGAGIRVDSGYAAGDTVTPYYDPLLAKLCAWGADRAEALDRLRAAAAEFTVEGPKCNLPFCAELLADADFLAGNYDTGLVARLRS